MTEKTLGEELKEINENSGTETVEEKHKRKLRELEEAESEAQREFDESVKTLPDRIKSLNEKGKRFLTILTAVSDSERYDFTTKENHLCFLLESWARTNGLKTDRRPWVRYPDDWDERESLIIYWE